MNKALQLLSLARKGGRIEAGEEPVDTCIRMGRARLILLASDASEHTCPAGSGAVSPAPSSLISRSPLRKKNSAARLAGPPSPSPH